MLNLEKMVAVSGKSGIFCMVGNRKDGLILEEYGTGKRFFAPTRVHQFTPLEGISIFNQDDATPLAEVFGSMLAKITENPLVGDKAEGAQVKAYFEAVMPDYDRDRVPVSDMRKVIKWFTFLYERNLLVEKTESAAEEGAAAEA